MAFVVPLSSRISSTPTPKTSTTCTFRQCPLRTFASHPLGSYEQQRNARIQARIHVIVSQAHAREGSPSSRRDDSEQSSQDDVRKEILNSPVGDPTDSSGSSIGSGNGGRKDNSGNHGSHGNGDDDMGDGDDEEEKRQNQGDKVLIPTLSAWQSIVKALSSGMNQIKEIPAAFIAMGTAILTTYLNQSYQSTQGRQKAMQDERKEQEQRRQQKDKELRALFDTFSLPLITSAAVLSELLYHVGSGKTDEPWAEGESAEQSRLYICYCIGTVLGHTEMIRHEKPTLDFGRPSGDRIFGNILGRLRFILHSSVDELMLLYPYYSGDKLWTGSKNDHLQMGDYAQTTLGELMRSRRWVNVKRNREDIADKDDEHEDVGPSKAATSHMGNISSGGVGIGDSVLAFADFVELFRHNKEFRGWVQPVYKSVSNITESGDKAKSCLRLHLFQAVLMDLIDYLDPPLFKVIPAYHRKNRLIKSVSQAELYFKNIGQGIFRRQDEELSSKQAVDCFDVFVPQSGTCPFSQRVILGLEELQVQYRVTAVDLNSKPLWYLNLHPQAKYPLAIHKGMLLDDSRLIIRYAQRHGNTQRSLADSGPGADLRLLQFFPNVIKWLKGVDGQANDSRATIEPEQQGEGARSSIGKESPASVPHAVLETARPTASRYTLPPSKTLVVGEQEKILKSKLEAIDASLQNHASPFYGGSQPSDFDVLLIPMLYHLDIIHTHVKPIAWYPELKNIAVYRQSFNKLPSFKSSHYVNVSEERMIRSYREIAEGMSQPMPIRFSRF